DGYFLDVYDVDHVYLLRKPVDLVHLEKALNRAGQKLHDLKISTLSVSNKQGMHNVPFSEILFFENERRRVHIHTVGNRISFYGRFDDLLDRLDSRFIRCHNSYIVNMARVREMSNKKFFFDGSKVVPISKTYYTEVREAFMSYVGSEMLVIDSGGGVTRLEE
ncbi:MAG: LytR/AlgR family response regulator transcription factor, partial [Lentihominibacter sp.]